MNSFILKENEPREKILEQFSAFRGILPQADDLSALFVKIE